MSRSRFPKGILRPGFLPARLMAFFTTNPDEELTHADILVKFGATKCSAKQAVRTLKLRQEIETAYVIRRHRP